MTLSFWHIVKVQPFSFTAFPTLHYISYQLLWKFELKKCHCPKVGQKSNKLLNKNETFALYRASSCFSTIEYLCSTLPNFLRISVFIWTLSQESFYSLQCFLDSQPKEDPRILGLAMIPGKHIVSIEIDDTAVPQGEWPDLRDMCFPLSIIS